MQAAAEQYSAWILGALNEVRNFGFEQFFSGILQLLLGLYLTCSCFGDSI